MGNRWTRRDVLRSAAALAAIPNLRAESSPVSSVMTRLSTYMAEAANRPLPAEVLEITKHHILDTLAAMISGTAADAANGISVYAHSQPRPSLTGGLAQLPAPT